VKEVRGTKRFARLLTSMQAHFRHLHRDGGHALAVIVSPATGNRQATVTTVTAGAVREREFDDVVDRVQQTAAEAAERTSIVLYPLC
jgi:mRNA-degrading endonuclease toxin of MazEF toxin-antitoxin module